MRLLRPNYIIFPNLHGDIHRKKGREIRRFRTVVARIPSSDTRFLRRSRFYIVIPRISSYAISLQRSLIVGKLYRYERTHARIEAGYLKDMVANRRRVDISMIVHRDHHINSGTFSFSRQAYSILYLFPYCDEFIRMVGYIASLVSTTSQKRSPSLVPLDTRY